MKKDDVAFPYNHLGKNVMGQPYNQFANGLSVRDYIAIQVLSVLIRELRGEGFTMDELSFESYKYADSLIQESERELKELKPSAMPKD